MRLARKGVDFVRLAVAEPRQPARSECESLALQAAGELLHGVEATRLTLILITHGSHPRPPSVAPAHSGLSVAEVMRVDEEAG
jgi:hypothetical protein